MILKQGFHLHPKTVMLRTRGGSAAVEALQQLWLFAENARMWQFPNWTREFVAAVGSIYGKPDLADLLTETGFLELMPGGGFALHDFAEHNGALIQRWENGRFGQLGAKYGSLGGRPRNPRETPGGGSGKPPVGGPKNPPTRPDQTRPDTLQSAPPPAEEELGLEGEPDATPKAKPPRPRNELFDALVKVECPDPGELNEAIAGKIAKALRLIRESTPGVTAQEIERRAANYPLCMPPGSRIGAMALANNWPKCGVLPQALNGQGGDLHHAMETLRRLEGASRREKSDPGFPSRLQEARKRVAELQGGQR